MAHHGQLQTFERPALALASPWRRRGAMGRAWDEIMRDPVTLAWRAAWIASSALSTDLCARQLCGLPEGEDRWRVHRMICDAWIGYHEDRRAAALLELAHGISHARFGLSDMPDEVLPHLQPLADHIASVIHSLQAVHDLNARQTLMREAREALSLLFARMLNAVKVFQGVTRPALRQPRRSPSTPRCTPSRNVA